ncbi:MAG: hypothetical protein IJR39_04890 [Treponema sp.]|nr:hypothetical protein [Treponema sp.]
MEAATKEGNSASFACKTCQDTDVQKCRIGKISRFPHGGGLEPKKPASFACKTCQDMDVPECWT